MGDRLGRAVRWLWAFLLLTLGKMFSHVKRFVQRILFGAWGIVSKLANLLASTGRGAMNLLGRPLPLFRRLIDWYFWQPLLWLLQPLITLVRWIWAFTGRCGLALRNLLTWFIWRPLLTITLPLRWFYRRVLRRPLNFVRLSLYTFAEWLLVDVIWVGLKALPGWTNRTAKALPGLALVGFSRIEAFIPGRRVRIDERLEEFGSRQLPGRRSVRLTAALEPVSSKIRFGRFTTAVVTTGILLILGVLTTQGRPTGDAIAVNDLGIPSRPAVAPLVPKMTLTPTSTPSPTSTPTPLPTIAPTIANDFLPWPTPDPLSSSGTILFAARDNGNSDIYALAIGRADPIQLTSHPADDRSPAWSPDGQRLAFASHRDGNWELYILDLTTGNLRRLTNNPEFDGNPSWSPDGQWLVYESYRNHNLDLFIIDVGGENPPIRVTEHAALDFSPSWSPDGRHIAYTSWRSGNKDIFIMSLDTASDEAALNVTASPGQHEDQAIFDPAGQYLAYYADNDGLDLINVLPIENYRPAAPSFSLGNGRYPSWSPDGNGLAFITAKETRSFIVAATMDNWAVAPQAYARDGILLDLDWTGLLFPRGIEKRFSTDAGNQETLFIEQVDPPQLTGPSFMLREMDVEAPSPYLSDKVDDSFIALRGRVQNEVGWDFLGHVDNMFSFLTARPFPGEPDRSWNKAARAFDFYNRYPISFEPQVEIVREDRGENTYWRVFLRAANQDGSSGEPLRQLPWDFTARYDAEPRYYDQGGKLKDAIPPGYYVDFTSLAADYGWSRAPALANWRTFFQGIRFWHFVNHQGRTWEEAILELYTADELEQAYGNR